MGSVCPTMLDKWGKAGECASKRGACSFVGLGAVHGSTLDRGNEQPLPFDGDDRTHAPRNDAEAF